MEDYVAHDSSGARRLLSIVASVSASWPLGYLPPPRCSDLPGSTLERCEQSVELLDVGSKSVHAAKRVRDRAEGALGIAVELTEVPFQALQLRVQDERAGSTFVFELPELGLGEGALWMFQHLA